MTEGLGMLDNLELVLGRSTRKDNLGLGKDQVPIPLRQRINLLAMDHHRIVLVISNFLYRTPTVLGDQLLGIRQDKVDLASNRLGSQGVITSHHHDTDTG